MKGGGQMADNIQFRVDAVLGNTTQLQQQINNLKTNLNININNSQALKAIQQVQRQFEQVKIVNGEIVSLTDKVKQGYQETTTTLTKNGTLTQTIKDNYAQLQKDVDNFNKKNLNGIDFEIQKREQASKRFSQQMKSQMEAQAQLQISLNKLGMDTGSTLNTKSIQDIESLKTALSSANIGWDNNNSSIKQFSQYIDNAGNTITKFTTRHKSIENGVEVWKDTSYAVSDADGKLRKYNESQQQVINSQMNLSTMLKSAIERFAVWGVAMKVWTGLGNAVNDCISYVEDLNSAMTNIRVVTMDTKEATQDLLDTYNQMAQDLGANTTDIASGAVDWLRQGFNQEDTAELVKDSTILSKLALIDNAQATEYLTSALKGYKLEAKDAMGIIDQLTAIDLEAATSAGDMAEALSRTANMAKTTGFEMNEVLGMIATMSEVTQNSASTIGNSVKTILSRMSNVKAGLDDFEGEALNDVEKTLNRVGIALRDNQGNWYDFYDVLDEVASKWDNFSDVQQSQITTALGGTRQRENVLVALENWELVKKYAETGANSAGTAVDKYGVILESVESKQAQLTAKTQEFYSNVLSDSVMTGLLDVGKGLMDIINIGDGAVGKVLLLTTATLALSAVLSHLTDNGKKTFAELIAGFIGVEIAEGGATAGAGLFKVALDLLKAHPVIAGFALLTTALIAGKAIFDHFNVTLEEQHEKAQQAQSDYQEIASELETVNSELKTTQERIDELNSKDKLSVTDKEELETLKKTNAELAKRQAWLKIEADNKKAEATAQAKTAWDKDFNKKNEYVSRYETQPKWNMWSQQWQDQGKSISETEHIQEYIRWYGELQKELDELILKEGEAGEEQEKRYNALQTQLAGVKSYLEETGAKIQTDFLDTYDVDDETKNGWIDLRDKIADVLGITYDTGDAMEDVAEASSNLEAPTFDDVFSDYASDIQSLSEKYEILTKAQNEYNEYGNITASTMKKIIDNGLLDYLTTENGQLQFNTQALQDNATATQNSAIAKLQEALFTDLQSIALGTYQDALNSTDSDSANAELQAFQSELGNTTTKALETATAISAVNSALGTDYQFSDKQKEQADAVVANYNAMVDKVKAISTNLSTGTYTTDTSSKSKKEWWEESLDNQKAKLEANEITMDSYIKNLEKLKGKLKKGSEGYTKVNKELQDAKLDNLNNQFERGEITIDQYINKLVDLRKSYKKNTEGYKELTQQINEAKADKFADQYERGEISLNSYIKKLKDLRDGYTKNSEEWKKYNDLIEDTQLDATEEWIEKLGDARDEIDNAIDALGDINTAKEQTKYAELLSKKYKTVQSDISKIQNKLKQTNLTTKERIKLQEELNKLIKDEVDIRDEIEDSVREYYENQKEKAEKEAEKTRKETLYNKEVELYGKGGKDLWEYNNDKQIDALKQRLDAREAEKEALDEINEREELQNDLIEARLKLQNALNNKTTKILKKQEDGTWQFEYSANMADVKSAKEEVSSAEKALDDFDWEQENQQIQDEIDRLNNNAENLANQYEDAEFWADREYEQTMNGIEQTYGNTDAMVEKWMKTYGGDATKLTDGYQSVVSANNSLEQSIIDLTTAIESEYETVGTNKVSSPTDGVKSFDTGGNIVGDGLILAHDKERVLTAQQNLYFEQLVSKLPQLLKMVDISKFNVQAGGKTFNSRVNSDSANSTVINKVECVFPNINSTDGLQQAILQLPRLALQKK